MKQQILKQLEEKHISSGGHCGLRLVDFGIDFYVLKTYLNQLYLDGLITIHDNHQGKLIKLKKY